MSKVDPKKLQELRDEHSEELLLIEEAGEQAVFKRPTRALYKRYRAELIEPRQKLGAFENLCFGCLVFPSREDFERILDSKPAAADLFGAKLLEVCGGEDVTVKG